MLLQPQMATLFSSLVTHPFYVGCGISQPSKLAVNGHQNRIRHHAGIMDNGRKLVNGESKQTSVKTPFSNLNKVYATSKYSVEQTEQIFSFTTEVEELTKVPTYLFRTEFGDLVKVFVRKKNANYIADIEVSLLQLVKSNDRLILCWGVYRSDSSCLLYPNFQSSSPDNRIRTTETTFVNSSDCRFALELGFESKQVPFYLSFLIKHAVGADLSTTEIRSHRKTRFCVPIGFSAGHPFPLGLSFSRDGSMNFSIFSRTAESMVLCLYSDSGMEKPALELDLDPYINRSGDIWHASFESAWNFVSNGYRCKGSPTDRDGIKINQGHVLLDPYAKVIGSSLTKLPVKYLGRLCKEPAFDWDGDVHPSIPMEKLVIYRLNVMRFTQHRSSQVSTDVAGTFLGLKEKLQHFRDLGVNAILLEPIFPFYEEKGPYFPFHFFSPTNLYGPSGDPLSAINSMKEMIKELHANGIEVILEVVFTHTAEDGALQGIDDSSYYYNNGVADLGNRNALNCNYPVVQQIILDSLRHWVNEFHIDGFCFINASSLLRGFHGEYLSRPPLVEAIAFDPLLSKSKIVADCWDVHELVTKETQFPHWKRWAEINTKYCNDVRNFLRGEGLLSSLATRLCGSGDVFSDGRGPAFSFNYISRNFGLPLVDLVSFSNTELTSELSWNCGEEGPTNKTVVLERRLKQIRNFLFVLFVSLGVPVLNMGDECGQSSGGSVEYNDRKAFDWNALKTGFGTQTAQFILFLSSFRARRNDLFQMRDFLKEENIEWYGSDQSPPSWEDPSCKFLGMMLRAEKEENKSETYETKGEVFIAFNASDRSESVVLPVASEEGMEWHRLVDTALPFPGFFLNNGEPIVEQMVGLVAYEVKPHSCALFETRSLSG